MAAGFGCVDHDAQVVAGDEQYVTVQRESADVGVVDGLAGGLVPADGTGFPEVIELGAVGAQLGDEVALSLIG